MLALNLQRRRDPTRTTTLLKRWEQDIGRRWAWHLRNIRLSVLAKDAFGILGTQLAVLERAFPLEPSAPRQFDFPRSADKVAAFMRWLEEQEARGILEIVRGAARGSVDAPWANVYIDTAYQRGIRHARASLRRAGAKVMPLDAVPGGISAVFNQPVHAERVALMYSRVFSELDTVTRITNTQVQRLVTDMLGTRLPLAIAQGLSPRTVAEGLVRDIGDRLDKVGRSRMLMIARTEIIRAHHEATITEFERAQVDLGEDTELMADWVVGGVNVCPICLDFEAQSPFKIEVIRGLIPAHPNCVAPWTRVSGRVQSVMRSRYRGPLLEIMTRNGRQLSVTPNHKVLTTRGFIAAQDLYESLDLLCCGTKLGGVSPSVDDHESQKVPGVEDLFESLRLSGALRVPGRAASSDFHGDGRFMDEQIDAVRADRPLRFGLDVELQQMLCEFGLEVGDDSGRALGSALNEQLSGYTSAGGGSPGSATLTLDECAVALVAAPKDALLLGHAAQIDARAPELPGQSRAADSAFVAQLFDRGAGLVALDHVREIRSIDFDGHVYDLQCSGAWYSSNDIVSHNCKCAAVPRLVPRKKGTARRRALAQPPARIQFERRERRLPAARRVRIVA